MGQNITLKPVFQKCYSKFIQAYKEYFLNPSAKSRCAMGQVT